ncbi:serine hydrolase domain-containing protein [Mycolicibacterium thermoresistibile]
MATRPAAVSGHCAPQFAPLHDALAANLASGEELGAALAVDLDGELVVDLWGGAADVAGTRAWQRDTVVNLWSITKTVTALAALILVDRGRLDLAAPVARYWPEFAANGKERVLVRHMLAHATGVAGWEPPFGLDKLYDQQRAIDRLAAQDPWWAPGSASGYHAQNMGHLVGELIRRVTGVSLTEFVAEEITGPLGADLRIGARDVDPERIAEIDPPEPMRLSMPEGFDRGPMVKTFTAPRVAAEVANTPEWRAAELGAMNGHGNARAVARVLSVVARGGAAGPVRLLSPATAALVLEEQTSGIDRVLGVPVRWGLGFALPTDGLAGVPDGPLCFWGGWGGSMVVLDLERRLTFAYTMNRMSAGIIGSARSTTYLAATLAALG